MELKEKEEREERKRQTKRKLASLAVDEDLFVPKDYSIFTEWLRIQARVLYRQFTFVVDGDTYCGKTMYLKTMLPGKTFICNCRGVEHPDLRDFEGLPYEDNILFDEGGPQMVQLHRDLFQAPKHDITLGQSGTNCYAYKVNVFRVRLAITCNDWKAALQKLAESDRKWVEKNTMVLSIDEYMFNRHIVMSHEHPNPV